MNTINTDVGYHFRTFPVANPTPAQAALVAAHPTKFEKVDAVVGGKVIESYKRLSEEATLAIPALAHDTLLLDNELELINDLLAQVVQDYCKTSYVDCFLPIGLHDLQTIIAYRIEAASRKIGTGGGAKSSRVPSDEVFAIGGKAFFECMQVLVPAFAQRIIDSELFAKKASYKAIKACLGSITDSRLSNFATRTAECLALIPDLQLGEDAAAATAAISYLHSQLIKMYSELFGNPEAVANDGM